LTAFLETGAPWALILEDDAALSDSVPEVLRLAAEGAIAADMVRFEGCGPILSGPLTPIGSGFSLCKNYSWSAGSAAYLASRHAAEVLVRGRWLRNQYADVALFDPYQPLARTLDVQQLNPALVVQQRWLEQQSGIGTTDLPSRPTPDRSFREVVRKVGTSLNRDVYGAVLKAWQRRFRGAAIRDVGFKPD
jgi:glycosyl transferase, family 25